MSLERPIVFTFPKVYLTYTHTHAQKKTTKHNVNKKETEEKCLNVQSKTSSFIAVSKLEIVQ